MNEFPSISSLIPNLRKNDEDAWYELVNMFQAGLSARARQLLRNSSIQRRIDADELANICFTKAWEHRRDWAAQTTCQFAAFLLTTMRNTFIDLCRPKNLEESCPSWFAPVTSEPTPSKIVVSEEEEACLHACLAELPERQRGVMVMRHLDGLKLREIAEALNPGLFTTPIFWYPITTFSEPRTTSE